MPLPALPAIAALVARIAVPVSRAIMAAGPAMVRGAGVAARTIGGGAMDAASAWAGSFAAMPGARPFVGGMARAAQTAASGISGVGNRVGAGIANASRNASRNVQAAIQQALSGRATGANPFGPATSTVQAAGGQSWRLPSQTLAGRGAAAANQPSRWMQRGAELYNQARHEAKREQQRDLIEFNKQLAAGAEGLKKYDPRAIAHFSKAAGIGLKMLAGVLTGPVGVVVAMAAFPRLVHGVTDSLIENRRRLGEINATYARTMITLDRERRLRTFSFAGGTASSFREMVQSVNKFEKSIQPYVIASAVVLQKGLTILTQIATTQSEIMKKIAENIGIDLKAFEDEAKAREKGMSLDIQILMQRLKKLGGERDLPPMPGDKK